MDLINAYNMAMTGQEEGYRFLYDSTSQNVYSYLLGEMDQNRADVMIGRVYEKAWAELAGLKDPNEFPGWVYGIAQGMVQQEKRGIPVPPIGADASGGAGISGSVSGGAPQPGPNLAHAGSPNAAHASSPNAAHTSGPNAAHASSPNVAHASGPNAAHVASQGASGGTNLGQAAGVKGAAAAKTAASGAKTAFLSTVAGKVVVGVSSAVAAAALITGGYFAAKKLNDKKDPEPASEAVSTEAFEAAEDTADTEEVSTENVTEAQEEETAAENERQLYEAYLSNVLIPERGIHAVEQDVTSSGPRPGEEITGPPWFDGSGIYAVDFDDYDMDGREEMLVISGRAIPAAGVEHYTYTDTLYILYAELFDEEAGTVFSYSNCDISDPYDGYQGGQFPFSLTKFKRNGEIYLISASASTGYRTDASTNASYELYGTSGEIHFLYSLYFHVDLQYDYYLRTMDGRSDPENPDVQEFSQSVSEDESLREQLTGGDLMLPLYLEQVPAKLSAWDVIMREDYTIEGDLIFSHGIGSYSLYITHDETGFHDREWNTSGDGREPQEEDAPAAVSGDALSLNEPLELVFSSGAGAWGTGLVLEPDGHFTGSFHDSDMGVTGPDYPYGTVYLSSFEGQFQNITRVDEYTYRMELDGYDLQVLPGTEEIVDGVRYIYSEPYGVEGGDVFYFYLPGKPVSELSEDFLSWGFLWGVPETGSMTQYGLYNEARGEGFFSYGN